MKRMAVVGEAELIVSMADWIWEGNDRGGGCRMVGLP
jgi:hypothetical protein